MKLKCNIFHRSTLIILQNVSFLETTFVSWQKNILKQPVSPTSNITTEDCHLWQPLATVLTTSAENTTLALLFQRIKR